MADTKALFTQRFDAARTAFTNGDEPAAAESLHSAIVVARSDPSLRRELASALFHLGKLSRKFGRAGEAEAESLLTEALTISEELFGRQHAALAPLLNELGRLHIHRSQYAGAADVLERLLAIARAKGDETADVATALAGLAAVKRKLGDDATAEALFKDALRIREKVLEPSHMVTVVTLEHLSETCAARGNFAEALSLLRRALAAREVALGPGHATVQAGRSRVAELELQAAVAADAAAAAAAKAARGAIATPVWLKRVPDAPAALSRERAKTPAMTAAVAAASLMASTIQMPSASQIAVPPPESARPSGSVAVPELSVPYRESTPVAVAPADVASDDAAVGDLQPAVAEEQTDLLAPARKKRTVLFASGGVAAVALAALLMLRPHAGSSTPKAAQRTASAPAVTARATNTGALATGAAAVVSANGTDSLPPASSTSAPTATASADQADTATPQSATPELRLPRVKVDLRPVNIPSVAVPNISAPSVDSMVRAAADRPRPSDTGRSATGDKPSAPAPADGERANAVNAIIPATIIGRVPEPSVPDALRSRRREGEVVVRFRVYEFGRVDVASMIVERSDNELFTAAVRDVLPRFRFEPARTRGADSKPVASWVSVPFRFTTKR
jgi:TonB family protein